MTSLKWKPPDENSVDFVLELRFPPSAQDPERPDYLEKPLFMLLMNHGSEHRYFDTMQVDDETWETSVPFPQSHAFLIERLTTEPAGRRAANSTIIASSSAYGTLRKRTGRF